jgi:hypothetical protein
MLENELRAEVEHCRREWLEACAAEEGNIAQLEGFSGPQTGTSPILQATPKLIAREKYRQSLGRFTEFILAGGPRLRL